MLDRTTWSYTLSAGLDRQPDGTNVDSGVDIAVVDGSTLGALPLTDRQIHFAADVSTIGTAFGRREPTVDHDQIPAVPVGFVFQLSAELAPTDIADSSGEGPVADHAAHVQIFDCHRLVFADQSSRKFVEMVASPVSDAGMDAGYTPFCFVSVVGAFLFTCQVALGFRQSVQVSLQESWVGDLFAGRKRCVVGESQIDADRTVRFWQRVNGRVVHEKRHMPTAGRVAGHCYCRRVVRDVTVESDVQRFTHFGECQSLFGLVPSERGSRVLGGVVSGVSRFELWVSGPFREEVAERCLLVTQRLLQRDRRHFVQPFKAVALFESGQVGGCLVVTGSCLVFVPGVGAVCEGPVPDHSDTSERARQGVGLLPCGVEPKPVRSLHNRKVTL